jgi:hypothetical protein
MHHVVVGQLARMCVAVVEAVVSWVNVEVEAFQSAARPVDVDPDWAPTRRGGGAEEGCSQFWIGQHGGAAGSSWWWRKSR